jgi:hypothetical protein
MVKMLILRAVPASDLVHGERAGNGAEGFEPLC